MGAIVRDVWDEMAWLVIEEDQSRALLDTHVDHWLLEMNLELHVRYVSILICIEVDWVVEDYDMYRFAF